MLVRLQKFLAEAGVASRRASEIIITEGRVTVNGKVVRELGQKVDPAKDRVAVDDQEIRPKRKLYIALNKPRGFLCSRRDPQARRCIAELLPKEWSGLYTVGRLDFDSEGLIFLTNDGQFSLRISHPRYGIRKTYLATVDGRVTQPVLDKFLKGVWYEEERLQAEKARILKATGGSSFVELVLREGKYREARRLFESQGFKVLRLQRIQIGPIKLGQLPSGKWRTLAKPEIDALLAATESPR